MPNYTICKRKCCISPSPKVFICCVCIADCGGKLNAGPRWTKQLLCGWSEVGFSKPHYAVYALLPAFHTLSLCLLWILDKCSRICEAVVSQSYRNGFNFKTKSLQEELPHRNSIFHPHLDLINWQYLSVCVDGFGSSSWPVSLSAGPLLWQALTP